VAARRGLCSSLGRTRKVRWHLSLTRCSCLVHTFLQLNTAFPLRGSNIFGSNLDPKRTACRGDAAMSLRALMTTFGNCRRQRGWVWIRVIALSSACLCAASCDPMEFAGVVIAPLPAIRADSAARVAFRDSALTLVNRVAARDGLHRYTPVGTENQRRWQMCLGLETFQVCGGEKDSIVHFTFWEWAQFTDQSNRIRHEIVDSLRQTFGNSLRECVSRRLRFTCPSKAQVDSGR
jgi:hypothetical protein